MRKIALKTLLFISLTLSCISCIPRVHTLAPGVSGTVIDAVTGKSIEGAVILDRYTNEQGRFVVPAKKELGLTFPFVGGHYLIETPFDVSAPGYQTRICRCTVVAPTPFCEEVRIPLQKLSTEQDRGKATKGHIITIGLDDEESVEGGVTCSPHHEETTIAQLEDAASNGSDSALYKLGVHYLQGINVEKNTDLGRYFMRLAAEAGNRDAYNFFFSAARQDDTEAEVLIGDLLLLGLGVEQNIRDALIWYEIAANNGDFNGMLRLAETYAADEVVPVDKEKSLYWYHKATETGSAEAMYELAEQYRYGMVTPPNHRLAIHWYVKAADAGSERAHGFLNEIIAAEEISATEKHEALEWQAKRKQ